jgi:hypothetical protein
LAQENVLDPEDAGAQPPEHNCLGAIGPSGHMLEEHAAQAAESAACVR